MLQDSERCSVEREHCGGAAVGEEEDEGEEGRPHPLEGLRGSRREAVRDEGSSKTRWVRLPVLLWKSHVKFYLCRMRSERRNWSCFLPSQHSLPDHRGLPLLNSSAPLFTLYVVMIQSYFFRRQAGVKSGSKAIVMAAATGTKGYTTYMNLQRVRGKSVSFKFGACCDEHTHDLMHVK